MSIQSEATLARWASLKPLSHSSVLWHKIELARPRLAASSVRFWTDPQMPARFPQFLGVLFQIIRGGLAVMREAADQCRVLAPNDAVAEAAGSYFERHLIEEQDHGEWLLQDIHDSGFNRTAVESAMVSGSVAALLGAQSFWVRHEHPVALFGYIAVVEGDPPTNAHLDAIRDTTGLPNEAFRCLREHAELDVGHVDELRAVVDSLPLTDRHQQVMALSAFETVEALARIFDELSAASIGAAR